MGIVEFSLKRRVTVAMAAVGILMFGGVAFTRLSMNLLPDISYPSLTIETRFAGAAPAEVESLLTRPVEEAVGVVAGVQRITSVSRPGLSQVTLELAWGRNMDFASLDVRQKLDLVSLPREATKPILLRFDPANDPILRLYVTTTETETDLYQLRYLGEEVLKKDLESSEGLAAVKVHGGYEEEIQIQIDEGSLALLGLTIDAVRDRLAQENVNQAGGSLYEEEARYLVRSRNEFEDLDDIRETMILNEGGRIVTLGDVAEVRRGHRQRQVVTRFDGKEAVELALYKEGDANTVRVAQAVAERLEGIRKELPEGVEVSMGADQSRFIQASVREVQSNALIGGVIAIVILLLFLKDLRSTLIIAISIPLSVVATFFLMYRTGTTLNIMSLGGLALGVGMLVDNAIVVLEAIYKRREAGEDAFAAALHGASEVGQAVVASTLTTVAVFIPVVFLEGVAAQLFRDQALTVSFSLMASLAVSLTLIPMLAAILTGSTGESAKPRALPPDAGALRRFFHVVSIRIPVAGLFGLRWLGIHLARFLAFCCRPLTWAFDAFLDFLLKSYPKVLRMALGARGLVILVAAVLLGGAISVVPQLGYDLIPTLSQGEFSFRIELPEGTPLEATDRFVSGVQSVLDGDERLASYSSIAGGAGLSLGNTGTEGENVARIQVRMQPGSGSDAEAAVAQLLRGRLEETPEASFKLERPSVFTFRTPIEIELYSDSLADLHEASAVLLAEVAEVPGVVDLKSSAELGNPELQVTFNREQLVQLGLDLSQVAATLRSKIQGDVATRLTEGDREIEVLVRSVELGEASVDSIGDLIVGQRALTRTVVDHVAVRNAQGGSGGSGGNVFGTREVTGQTVPIRLKSVATISLVEGPTEIRRINQKRAALISGNLADRDMGATATDLEQVLHSTTLPLSVLAGLGGQQEEMTRSLSSHVKAMALAIFLVYLVMASQFESFLHPFVIIFTLPLAAIGVVAALALTANTISVVALIGAVMLAGIVVNNAIVLIDAVNHLRREEGLSQHEALIEAGLKRLRPILMTSATTIFGLLPMALGLGEGAELRAPLAITVIGGLTVATLLTLVVIPVVYSLLDRKALPAQATS
jgi:HAE1 family hydrophobic/amphiphilic exporter-1